MMQSILSFFYPPPTLPLFSVRFSTAVSLNPKRLLEAIQDHYSSEDKQFELQDNPTEDVIHNTSTTPPTPLITLTKSAYGNKYTGLHSSLSHDEFKNVLNKFPPALHSELREILATAGNMPEFAWSAPKYTSPKIIWCGHSLAKGCVNSILAPFTENASLGKDFPTRAALEHYNFIGLYTKENEDMFQTRMRMADYLRPSHQYAVNTKYFGGTTRGYKYASAFQHHKEDTNTIVLIQSGDNNIFNYVDHN